MTVTTFHADDADMYMMQATAASYEASANLEKNLSQSLQAGSEHLQTSGMDYLKDVCEAGKGHSSNYVVLLSYESMSTLTNGEWGIDFAQYAFADPGWGTSNQDQETQSYLQVLQEYSSMQSSGFTSFNNAISSSLSQTATNTQANAQFAGQISNNANFVASIIGAS